MNRDDFVLNHASEDEMGEEELDEEEFDEDGEPIPKEHQKNSKPRDYDDSSDEEEDEDEEAVREVQEGFIVEDEDEEEEEEEESQRRRSKGKKRKHHRDEEEDDDLDDDDIDLVMENTGIPRNNQFKRLKRANRESERVPRDRELLDISSDEEDYADARDSGRGRGRQDYAQDDMADFIEHSDEEGDGESEGELHRRATRDTQHTRLSGAINATGLTEESIRDMEEVFGNGDEYAHFLVTEPLEQMQLDEDQPLELKDVFEPSELAEKMLTEEDTQIKNEDVPERFQLARKPYSHLPPFDDDILNEEGEWIAEQMLRWRPSLDAKKIDAFTQSVKTVILFMNRDQFEVPFIWQHRRDFLQYTYKVPAPQNPKQYELKNEDLLERDDLWEIFEWDLKFRSFFDKKAALKKIYEGLETLGVHDELYEQLIRKLDAPETVADLLEYIHFRYQAELKDLAASGANGSSSSTKRPRKNKTIFERIRSGKVYGFARAFGISADDFAVNMEEGQPMHVPDDPAEPPLAVAERYMDDEFNTPERVISAAKTMFVEELFMNPRLRKSMTREFIQTGLLRVVPTEKGVKKIDDQHIYYEFKYLKNQHLSSFFKAPGMFLKMLKAEDEGLVEVKVEHEFKDEALKKFYEWICSENVSEVANAWNSERRDIIDKAFAKFEKLLQKVIKETVRNECEDRVALSCRREFWDKLDQAPYHTPVLSKGDVPRVLVLSPGHGERGKDAIVGIFMDEHGRLLEHMKLPNIKDEMPRSSLITALRGRNPDVIGIAGFSVMTHRLKEELEALIAEEQITISGGDDSQSYNVEVLYVPDEVARLYMNSPRSREEFPELPPLGRYCVALARYLQDPLMEYAAIKKEDLISLRFDPVQHLIPVDKLHRQLESALVDAVNVVGVSINDAVKDTRVQNLLPFVAGLGPRKANAMLKAISTNGGRVNRREELIGDPAVGLVPALGLRVFANAASFFIIEYEQSDEQSEFFDSTRVHIEDYDLGRKMAGDALEYDEEDVVALQQKDGSNAVITELLDGHEDKLHELILEDYAEELENNFNQKKRMTLETIRNELLNPYGELRSPFKRLDEGSIFTMLTGETKQSLRAGMVVPVNLKRVSERFIAARLDCGVDGNVSSDKMTDLERARFNVYAKFEVGQTVPAFIETINYHTFYAELSLRERDLRRRRPEHDHHPSEWDEEMEEKDKARMEISNQEHQRTTRVIKHPLFRSFNRVQAEEYLKGMGRGDAVIRPSSNGLDHIAITWKVHDGIYHHIDVLELDKDNEFSVGKTLRVQGKYSYSDLDELIVEHVKAMARKVDEMTSHAKFLKDKDMKGVEEWLTTFTKAYPKRSAYAFCFDPKHPGYFALLFKAGLNAPINHWAVKVIPNAFELRGKQYPDMTALCNGFKMMWNDLQKRNTHSGQGAPRPVQGGGGYGMPQHAGHHIPYNAYRAY